MLLWGMLSKQRHCAPALRAATRSPVAKHAITHSGCGQWRVGQLDMSGSIQREALATRSVEKTLELIFSIVTPQYWCQNDCTDEWCVI